MNDKIIKKNSSEKLGTMPMGKLLFVMSAPAILSMLVLSLYNVVDSIFVANYSQNGLVALSYAFPMQMLVMAFAIGIGVGTNSLVSRKLGEGKTKEASSAAQTGLFCALVVYAVFLIIGYFVSKAFIEAYTADVEIREMGINYLSITTMASIGMFVEVAISKSLQATGNMIVPMISQLIGAIINIALDPILIFGYLGAPRLGVTGAAIATVTGQIVSMIFVIIVVIVKKPPVRILFSRHFRLNRHTLWQIFIVALPTTVMNAIGSFTTMLMNTILNKFSQVAVAVLGVYFKLQSFVFMPVFGLTQGAMPIMGYNYGAGNKKRFNQCYFLSLTVACVILAIGLLIFQFAPAPLLKLFNADENMLSIGVRALRLISICFIPAAFGIVITAMFQAIGHGTKSLIMSLLRQVVFILPFAYLFGQLGGVNNVWWCYPLAETLVAAIFIPVAFAIVNKVFKNKSNLLLADAKISPVPVVSVLDTVFQETGESSLEGVAVNTTVIDDNKVNTVNNSAVLSEDANMKKTDNQKGAKRPKKPNSTQKTDAETSGVIEEKLDIEK